MILYLKDQDQPIRGYYVRENEHAVVLLELLPNGSTAERSVPRSQIDDMIRSVSEERLAALRPENPDGYREYAEELAEKRKDPDAQLTGLRLYQMAAVLEPQRLGRSCLLGMVPLARDAAELRRFRALAYLLDPDHDPALLRVSEQTAVRSTGSRREAGGVPPEIAPRAAAREAQGGPHAGPAVQAEGAFAAVDRHDHVRRVREGVRAHVSALHARASAVPGVWRKAVGRGERLVARALLRLRRQRRSGLRGLSGNYKSNPLTPSLLKRILALELAWLPGADEAPDVAPPTRPTWSRAVQLRQFSPARELTLETLTEFNPRQNRYQDGQWKE